ncbi:hypothetical protein ACFOW1_00025 [Parasediminibacterium paludis]|uniref:Lipoprotein n=1 Tax=Parasediminibacterium paludis TaxID=908966 RepID=A0ABV8PSG7_9BACT
MKKNIFFLVIGLLGCFCKPKIKSIEFQINPKYIGPCIVFINNDTLNNNTEAFIIDNGLAKIHKNLTSRPFIFKHENDILSVVQIGEEDKILRMDKKIFGLTLNTQSTSCAKRLETITFFIGNKSDYIKWLDLHKSEFEYFEEKGIDWCRYYNSFTNF